MTSQRRFKPDDSSQQPVDEPEKSTAPPPPPQAPQDDDDQDVGLATEMVFSGHERQRLRDAPDYETFETGVLSFDDEELYQDVAPQEDDEAENDTVLRVTHDQSEGLAATTPAQSFDPRQHYSQQTGTTNEPFALLMFIILTLVALGIFTVLGWLIYQLIMDL